MVKSSAGDYIFRMQVRTTISLCIGLLAIVIVAGAGLSLWNTNRVLYNHDRTSLAYQELGGYLQLSGEIFRTFKQARRDLLSDSARLTFDLESSKQRIERILEEIIALEEEEKRIGLRPHETQSDEARIRELREELALAFRDIRSTEDLLSEGRAEEAAAFLGESLKTRIDGRVDRLIEAGIADEQGELTDALGDIELWNRTVTWLSIAAVAVALGAAGLVIFSLVLRLKRSLGTLEAGAACFARGELHHQIPISGQDEFATLSQRFNLMAQQLLQQREALERARASLELRVAERTRELFAANAELKRRDATRREFFADIGHELRTPITALRGEAEVALRVRSDREAGYRYALERIVEISDQLTRFVNDIFLIAREQAGVLDLRLRVFDLRDAVRAGFDHMHATLDLNAVEAQIDLPSEEALIEGDEERVSQLVRILVSNAIEHASAGQVVRVRVARVDNCWQLSVEDNGPGIPEGEQVRVFERFYRGAGLSDEQRATGTGLGLPIARSLVQAHGGRIWIDRTYRSGLAVRATFAALDVESETADVDLQTPARRAVQ